MIIHKLQKKWSALTPRFGVTRQRRGGFTLLEIIVVLAIFSTLVVLITNVFLTTLRAQRQTSYRQKTLSQIRQVMETIARQVRISEIDYSAYDVDGSVQIIPTPTNTLNLSNGLTFTLSQNRIARYQVTIGAPSGFYLTDPADVEVVSLKFYINPTISPFREERCRLQDSQDPLLGCSPTSDGCTINVEDDQAIPTGYCQCQASSQEMDCRVTKRCVVNGIPETGQNICLPPDEQPRVTINIGLKSKGTQTEEEKIIFLQTTVSSRIYRR